MEARSQLRHRPTLWNPSILADASRQVKRAARGGTFHSDSVSKFNRVSEHSSRRRRSFSLANGIRLDISALPGLV